MSEPEATPPSRFRRLLRRTDQVAIAVLVGGSLVVMAAVLIPRGYLRGRVIDLDRTPPQSVSFQLDINTADWPELMLLPNVGESLARRIVQVRNDGGPFVSPEELRRRVPGIGPKTLDGIRPYLLPAPSAVGPGGAPPE